jgi:hypothetical protein
LDARKVLAEIERELASLQEQEDEFNRSMRGGFVFFCHFFFFFESRFSLTIALVRLS